MTHTAEAVYIWVSSRSTPTFFLFGGLNAMRYNEIFVSMAWNECENVYNGELCITNQIALDVKKQKIKNHKIRPKYTSV